LTSESFYPKQFAASKKEEKEALNAEPAFGKIFSGKARNQRKRKQIVHPSDSSVPSVEIDTGKKRKRKDPSVALSPG
jgi:hypothetical protein